MSDMNDLLSAHPLNAKIEALDELLNKLISSGKVNEDREKLLRFKAINSYLAKRIATVDPILLDTAQLDALESYVTEQTNNLNSYHNFQALEALPNRQARQYLGNAVSHANQLITQLGTLPLPQVPDGPGADGIKDILVSVRRSAGQYMRQIQEEYDSLNVILEEQKRETTQLLTEVNTQKGRLDSAIAEFQQQFSHAEENRRAQAATSIEEKRKEFSDLLAKSNSDFESLIKEITEKLRQDRQAFADQGRELLDNLEVMKGRAEAVLRVIGNTGMVEGYQRVANEERKTAMWWHVGTLVFMIGLIAFAIVAFWNTVSGEFHLGTFGARAFVALTFGIAAAYAAREADKHQSIERKNRRVELELASIDPFLSAMPQEMQHEVKRQLAERIFGQNDPLTTKDGDTTGTLADLLKMALGALNNFSKK